MDICSLDLALKPLFDENSGNCIIPEEIDSRRMLLRITWYSHSWTWVFAIFVPNISSVRQVFESSPQETLYPNKILQKCYILIYESTKFYFLSAWICIATKKKSGWLCGQNCFNRTGYLLKLITNVQNLSTKRLWTIPRSNRILSD